MDNKKILKHSSLLMGFTLMSRILGLVRVSIEASLLGTGALNDAYQLALTIPSLLRKLFAEGSIATAFIPTFKGYLTKESKKETADFLNSAFTALTFLVTLTVIAGMIITPLVLPLFNTYSDVHKSETILLTRIMFPYLAMISLAALFQGILNCINVYWPGGFVPVLLNIIIICSALFLSQYTDNPARALAIGMTVGGMVQMLFQLPFVLKNRFRFRFISLKAAFANPGTRMVGRLIAPTLLGIGAFQLNNLISTSVATWTGEGVLSSLRYSLRLQELILGIFAVSLGTVLVSTLSEDAKRENWSQFQSSLTFAMNILSLITIPVSFFAWFLADEIVTMIYMRGAFNEYSMRMTADIFRFHIIGVFFIANTRIISPAFYALKDTKTPAFTGVFSLIINIVCAVILAQFMKGNGIALALTISSVVNFSILCIYLCKKNRVNFKAVLNTALPYILRMAVLTALSALPLFFLKGTIYALTSGESGFILSQAVPFAMNALLFFGTGVLLLIITKDPNIKQLKRAVKSRL